MPCRRHNAKLSPISKSVTRSLYGEAGVALLELMLVVGVIAIGTAAIVATYKTVDSNRKINKEADRAIGIAVNVATAGVTGFGTVHERGAYMGLNDESAKRYGLFPKDMPYVNGYPQHVWGDNVLITATEVYGKPNWGAAITFEGVPDSACVKFASKAAPSFYSVSVNQTTVRDNYGPVDVSALTTACTDDATVQFVYAKSGAAGNYVDPKYLAPCTAPAPTTQVVVDAACPTGQLGTAIFRTDYVCYSPYGPATDLPEVKVSDTCASKCSLPSPNPQVDPQTRPWTRQRACPPGQSAATGGNMGITDSQQQRRERTRVASCPPSPGYSGPVGAYEWSDWTPWSNWVGTTPWVETSTTCAPTCVAPAPTTQTEPGTGTCATGRVTPGGATTYARSRTRAVNYTCPGPTGAYDTVNGSWSAWSPAETVACAPKCVLPSTNPKIDPDARQNPRTFNCPSGQLITTPGPWQYQSSAPQTRNEKRTRSSTASCPTPTGPVAWTPWSDWSGWTGTTPWTPAFTCAAACTVPASWTQYTAGPDETRTVKDDRPGTNETKPGTPATRSAALCPASQYGLHSQTRATTITRTTTQWREDAQTRATQRARTVSYTCSSPTGTRTTHTTPWGAPSPTGPWPAPIYGPWGAPTTPYGDWSAPTPSGSWTSVSNNCKACPAPVTEKQQNPNNPILYNSYSCAAGYYGYYGRSYNQHRERVRSYACPSGTKTLPAPDYTDWSGWINGAITTTSTNCFKCPAPSTERKTQWPDYPSYNCPAGKYGYNWREREQESTRSKSYACPSGTRTLPAPDYTEWTPWKNTGTTRDKSGTNCVSCPAPTTNDTDLRWYGTYNVTCPSGQTGTIKRERQQERKQTKSYDCPAKTQTLPEPTYTWSGWYNNGTTRLVSNTCTPICAPKQTIETESMRCSYPQTTVTAGRRSRTAYWTCPGPTITSYSPWTIIIPKQCCPAGRICEIQ